MGFYFAYGSNLNLKQMQERCPDCRKVGSGVLKGYRWIISQRGYANIIESESDEVWGVVYEISKSDEYHLDIYEGVDSGCYEKYVLQVECNGRFLDCLVYIDPLKGEGKADDDYIDIINRGIRDAALPQWYVSRYIRRYMPA